MIPDDARGLSGVDTVPKALCLVVLHDRSSLRVESTQALAQGLDIIVGTLDERFSRNVVDHVLLRGAKNN